jgi:hypothetical protein
MWERTLYKEDIVIYNWAFLVIIKTTQGACFVGVGLCGGAIGLLDS